MQIHKSLSKSIFKMKRLSSNSKEAHMRETVFILLPYVLNYSDPGGAFSQAKVCGLSLARIAGSNLAGGIYVGLL